MKRPRYKVSTKPCERCRRPTKERQEMFDGRRAFLCSHCWRASFTPEQRRRILQARDERQPRKVSPAREVSKPGPVQTAACQDCREQFPFRDTWGEDRRRFCRRCIVKRERLDLARALGRTAVARARSRRKGAKSGSVWTVRGGLPGLGKGQ